MRRLALAALTLAATAGIPAGTPGSAARAQGMSGICSSIPPSLRRACPVAPRLRRLPAPWHCTPVHPWHPGRHLTSTR